MEQTLPQPVSKVKALQLATIAWMLVELAIALAAGIRSHSLALTAFGADSVIELVSAVAVLRRFILGEPAEKRTARMTAFLLYALAAFILGGAVFTLASGKLEAVPSMAGIILLVATAIVMPVLGRAKRNLALQTGSRALNADAAQSNICAYMSWIALAGLSANLWLHIPWADPVAALALIPIVLKEANDARKGHSCECC